MATATKSTNKPTAKKTAATTKPTPAAKGAQAKTTKTAAPAKTPKAAAKTAAPAKPVAVQKPIKTAFNKSSLITHVAEASAVEPKAVKAVFASLEATILASVHKKGLGSFTLPGLLKVNVVNVPAKKKRTGIDPFTKQERVFAAKPATVKIKTRALKKLKDAAL
ncbi:HU family DNA-binding protein [Aquabacterium sp.]|uniref:HU family DNA-binding protein n=1 Tax=Aquabacterium sp. TaxID=1872578 RepID=UPI002BDFBAD6|nr:HU family DNA-binding protein [Aquabacterium sp.]HSW04791.1 HU family DNA-binding protein [Aquabacterium sp.]